MGRIINFKNLNPRQARFPFIFWTFCFTHMQFLSLQWQYERSNDVDCGNLLMLVPQKILQGKMLVRQKSRCLGSAFVVGYLRIDKKSSYFQYIKMLKKKKKMMLLNSGTVFYSSVH